jgi:hypothetical protein
VTDEELTDAWEAGALGRAIGHEDHVRIGRVLLLRHGRAGAAARLVDGTRLNAADRFDEELTRRWARTIADAFEAEPGDDFAEFAEAYPELLRSDLLGLPAWRA